ncbi:class I SAM-dependent methyltransferase [Conexibacter sp. DBS9H8]|uniref:class I SAM-dependent methyltransferase n=1 Tax=Conexibacter sp. DBS9H8 TaxID=2937801 RepID=UPI00200F68C3|nr:methyltransferase domain-containing protein [Conexibacter sp. DBS9H8]
MSDAPASAVERWNRLSERYDAQHWLERASIRQLLDLLAPGSEDRMVDVGTGTGAVLRDLRARPVRPAELVGVDQSPRMLAQVPPLPAGWTLARGDARALPLPDAHCEVASVSYLLHLFEAADRGRVLAEVHRVLRPGGRVGVLTPYIPAGGWLAPLARAFSRLADGGSDHFIGLKALDPVPDLTAAGFAVRAVAANHRGYISVCVVGIKGS